MGLQKEREAFEAWYFKQNHLGIEPIDHARESYKAGAASRQTEIDGLQKRIDEALIYLRHIDSRGYGESVLSKILKGKQND